MSFLLQHNAQLLALLQWKGQMIGQIAVKGKGLENCFALSGSGPINCNPPAHTQLEINYEIC